MINFSTILTCYSCRRNDIDKARSQISSDSGCHYPIMGLRVILLMVLHRRLHELYKVASISHITPVKTALVEIIGFY